MKTDEEFIEGKKGAKADFKSKNNRDLTRYPSDHYRQGYHVQYASLIASEKRKNKKNKNRRKK